LKHSLVTGERKRCSLASAFLAGACATAGWRTTVQGHRTPSDGTVRLETQQHTEACLNPRPLARRTVGIYVETESVQEIENLE